MISSAATAPSSSFATNEFWAVDNVSFEVQRGECLGLIGRNGAGKTTLLKMLNGLIKPDRGRIEMRGRVGALIALGAGFNPILTGRENIYVNGAVLGLSKKEIDAKYDEIVDFAEIGEFIDAPVQSYSSGMNVRLGFAIATALNPDVLLLDEVLAVGDANFQAKCYRRIGNVLKNSAVILVSHYAHHITKICDKAILLDHGRSRLCGAPTDVLIEYNSEIGRLSAQPTEPLTILGAEVSSAKISWASPKVDHGGKLEIVLEINAVTATRCDQAFLNIVDRAENVHAQVNLDGLIGDLPPGVTKFSISIGPLYLSKVRLAGNLLMSGSGGKNTLVHLRNCLEFESDGPLSLGPFYYPLSIVRRNHAKSELCLDLAGNTHNDLSSSLLPQITTRLPDAAPCRVSAIIKVQVQCTLSAER